MTARAPGRDRADRLFRGSDAGREGLGGPAHLGGVRAGGRVRPDPQQLRLPAAHLQRPRRHACRDDDPRVLVRADRAGLREVQRGAATTSRSATPTGTRSSTTSRRSTTASTCTSSTSGAARATTCCSSAGSIPTRGPPRLSTWPSAAGVPLIDRRDRPGRRLLRAVRGAAGRRRAGHATSARSVRDRRGELLGGARALLHLVNFDEPFGFSVVEAMACGTPVIARARGSMPELVRDGENGFLVDSARRGGRRGPTRRRARPARRARIGRGALRRQPDGGRLPRRLPAGRGAPPREARPRTGADPAPSGNPRFRVGVNYWPARTAMAWWSSFDQDEVAADFARIAATGLDSVRLFLTWRHLTCRDGRSAIREVKVEEEEKNTTNCSNRSKY